MPGYSSPSFLTRFRQRINILESLIWGNITGVITDQLDLQAVLDEKSNILHATFGVIPETTNAKPLKVTGINLSTGDTDVYTAPAGKRAIVYGYYVRNPSAGTINFYSQIKISGVYYRIGAATAINTVTATSVVGSAYILEPGEILSVHTATTNGLNIWFRVIEFDNDFPLRSVKILALANGDNTIYTCANLNGAMHLDTLSGTFGAISQIYVTNTSGGARAYIAYHVPNGGTPDSTNQLFTISNLANNGLSSAILIPQIVENADFIVLNTDSGAAGQVAWVNVFEP